MKQYYIIAALLLSALFASCSAEESDPVQKPAAPKFEFSIAGEAFSVEVDSSVVFTATRLEGTGVRTEWSVDGEKVAGTPSVTWKFTKLGVSNVHFEASNELGKVEKDYAVTVTGSPLDVSFSVEEESIDAVVGSQMEVSVTVLHGDKGTVHSWTLDGTEIGTGTSVSRIFEVAEVGTHTLAYNGINTDGMTASRTWTVTVRDLPLLVTYSPEGDTASAMEGRSITFKATVVHGSTGAAWSWKVNDTETATGADFVYECTSQGTYAVSVTVSNSAGESDSHSWTLTVTEPKELSYMLLDAETLSALPSIVTGNNTSDGPCVKLVDNPYVTAVNSGSKVFVDDLRPTTWKNSGYVQVMLTEISTKERSKYTTVRVKVYIGTSDYVPYMYVSKSDKSSLPAKVNGEDFYPSVNTKAGWDALVRHNEWNILEYNLNTGNYNLPDNTLADLDQIQFRFTVMWGNGSADTAQSDTNLRIVYFDDVELLN